MNGYLPWLSIATGSIELVLALWAVSRTRHESADAPSKKHFLYTIAAMLMVLAGYQFAEAWVCANPDAVIRARIAFIDVTWLPPIGLFLVMQLRDNHRRVTTVLFRIYLVCAVAFTIYLAGASDFVATTVCATIFATYQHGTPIHHLYGVYYYVGLSAIIVGAAYSLVSTPSTIHRAHLADIQIGILGFMIPAFITQIIWKSLDLSIPSIMCHYAIITAVMLARMIHRSTSSSASK